jgi:hypothetical protein
MGGRVEDGGRDERDDLWLLLSRQNDLIMARALIWLSLQLSFKSNPKAGNFEFDWRHFLKSFP